MLKCRSLIKLITIYLLLVRLYVVSFFSKQTCRFNGLTASDIMQCDRRGYIKHRHSLCDVTQRFLEIRRREAQCGSSWPSSSWQPCLRRLPASVVGAEASRAAETTCDSTLLPIKAATLLSLHNFNMGTYGD